MGKLRYDVVPWSAPQYTNYYTYSTGGYVYDTAGIADRSVSEYTRPISSLLEEIQSKGSRMSIAIDQNLTKPLTELSEKTGKTPQELVNYLVRKALNIQQISVEDAIAQLGKESKK